jgi:heme A synthase
VCFSAQASFIAAISLSALGIFLLKKARTRQAHLLALIPLLFGIQQGLEGIVWVTLNNQDEISYLHKMSMYGYLFFATIFWPLYISITLYYFERNKTRAKFLLLCILLGLVIACANSIGYLAKGAYAVIIDHHIHYDLFDSQNSFLDSFNCLGRIIYLVAAVGALFISSIPDIWIFGVLALIGFIVAQVAYAMAFGSVWCFFAAVASFIIYYIIDKQNKIYARKK